MRNWVVVVVAMLLACKKNADKPTQGSGSQAVAVVADAAAAPVDAAPTPAPIDEDKFLDTESIGPLKLGMTEAAATKVLGKPKQKTLGVEEPASGLFTSTWSFDGIALHMAGEKRQGPFKVSAITVTNAPHATARGIKIGSTLAEVAAAYPRSAESEGDPEAFLVGSPYGGLLFKLQKDVVTEIFLGALAE